MSFIKAMQFALTEYICVSSEGQDGSPDDDIQACCSHFFHKEVMLGSSHLFLPI